MTNNEVGRVSLGLEIGKNSVVSDTKRIGQQAAGTFQNQFKGVGQKIGKFMAAAFAVKEIVAFGKECMELGSDLTEVQNVVETTFGAESVAKINKFAREAITKLGLSETAAKQAVGTFGAMATAFGFTDDEAYNMSTSLTELASGISSFYNMSSDEAMGKLKSVFTGETESLKSLGVVMSQTALDAFAMEQGFGKTTKEMSEQEKVALRYKFVMKQLEKANGDFAKTSGTSWANQTRIFSQQLNAFKASVGQGLINALMPVIKVINQMMAKLMEMGQLFKKFTADLFGDASGGENVGGALTEAGEGAESTADGLDDAATSATKLKKALAGFDELNVLSTDNNGSTSAVDSSLANLATTNSSADTKNLDESLTKAEGSFKKFKNNIEKMFPKTSGAIAGLDFAGFKEDVKRMAGDFENSFNQYVKPTAENLFSTLGELCDTQIGNIIERLSPLWEGVFKPFIDTFNQDILPTVSSMFNGLVEIAKPAIKNIQDAFWTIVDDAVLPVLTDMTQMFSEAWDDISEVWDEYGAPLVETWKGVFEELGESFKEVWNTGVKPIIDDIRDRFKKLWEDHLRPLYKKLFTNILRIGKAIGDLWKNYVIPFVTTVLTTVLPIIRKWAGILQDTFEPAVSGIIDALGAVTDFLANVFEGNWRGAWQSIKEIFEDIFGGLGQTLLNIVNVLVGVINGLLNAVGTGFNKVIDAINTISFEIPDWVPVVGGKKFDLGLESITMPQIPELTLPALANGAYLGANTPRLAVVGDNKTEGEFVAPESKLKEAVIEGMTAVLGKLSGMSAAGNVNVYIGNEQVEALLVRTDNRLNRRSGGRT